MRSDAPMCPDRRASEPMRLDAPMRPCAHVPLSSCAQIAVRRCAACRLQCKFAHAHALEHMRAHAHAHVIALLPTSGCSLQDNVVMCMDKHLH
eukprot:365438-Chlamydomonas_euryale.AAC.2